MATNTEIKIWERLIKPSWATLPPEEARIILKLKFKKSDIDRMNELTALVKSETISERQRAELEGYLQVGRILTIMHSQARQALQHRGVEQNLRRRKAS